MNLTNDAIKEFFETKVKPYTYLMIMGLIALLLIVPALILGIKGFVISVMILAFGGFIWLMCQV